MFRFTNTKMQLLLQHLTTNCDNNKFNNNLLLLKHEKQDKILV